MKKYTVAAICLLLLLGSLPLAAQTDDDEMKPARFTFQGRVGVLYPGSDLSENGATFEIAGLWRLSGPIYLMGYTGIGNFVGGGEVVPITQGFTDFWSQLLDSYTILNVDELRYHLTYGGGGVALMTRMGNFEPILAAGVGAYQVKLVASVQFVDKTVPPEFQDMFAALDSFEDSETFLGYMFSAGLYYHFNEIISFGGQGTYHRIDTDKIEDPITFTIGLQVNVP